MRKVTISLLILFYTCAYAFAQDLKIAKPRDSLKIGEELDYSVEWLGIPVGKIILKVQGIEVIRGYSCYHITARALPNNFLKKIYDIEYTVDSFLDTRNLHSLRFEKTRIINNEQNLTTIDFDPQAHIAKFKSEGGGRFNISSKRKELESENLVTDKIPPGTQDLLSSFYYFRLQDIQEGASCPLNIYYDRRNWVVKMKVDKPFLRDIRKKGSFALVKIYPDSAINEYILGRRKFEVYVTIDSSRIPFEFKLHTALGSIYARLQHPPE